MNRAELDALIAAEKALLEHGTPVTPEELPAFRAGHAAGYKDGLAAGKTSNHSPQTATTVTASIFAYAECPTCQANWGAMKEMLAETGPTGSDNYDIAQQMLANCRTCREHFAPKACGPPCGNYPAKTADECTFCKCR